MTTNLDFRLGEGKKIRGFAGGGVAGRFPDPSEVHFRCEEAMAPVPEPATAELIDLLQKSIDQAILGVRR